MSGKLKGVLVSIGSFVLLIVLTIVIGVVVARTAPDAWAGIGVMFMMVFVSGFIMLAMLIVGIVLQVKKQSEFGAGLVIGIGSMIAFGVLSSILISIYNLLVT